MHSNLPLASSRLMLSSSQKRKEDEMFRFLGGDFKYYFADFVREYSQNFIWYLYFKYFCCILGTQKIISWVGET